MTHSLLKLEDGRLLIRGANAHLELATWELPDGDGPPKGEVDVLIFPDLLSAYVAEKVDEAVVKCLRVLGAQHLEASECVQRASELDDKAGVTYFLTAQEVLSLAQCKIQMAFEDPLPPSPEAKP